MLQDQSRTESFGYGSMELMHRGERSIIYRARRGNEPSVVIKVRRDDEQRLARRASLEREWDLLRRLRGVEGVIQAARLEREAGRVALVLRDIGAASLEKLALAGSLSSVEFVELALQLTFALEALHRQGVIHRDVRPANVVLEPRTGKLELIDFASATLLTHDSSHTPGLGRLEGTLAYMSPEQTGRMNRSVDHRTDYYSLGVSLFELATGILPFSADDPLQLAHAHVARQPPNPAELNPAIPRAVCEIILKLLSKDAEQRYQTLAGLATDLEHCRARLKSGAAEFSFPLSAQRPRDGFELSHRLYGRDSAISALREVFERAVRGTASGLALAGGAGVGKSSLAREVIPWLSERRGLFVAGKFEQYEGSVPYAALGQALESLSQQLLGDPSDGAAWQARLKAGLQGSWSALADLVPSLEQLAGPRRPASTSPEEARRRVKHAVEQFLSAASSTAHPICWFLDDVQWADPDSLELIVDVVSGLREHPILLLLAFREFERSPEHALTRALERLISEGVPLERLQLAPLELKDISALISDAVELSPHAAERLAAIVHQRTGGNPLFVRSFLESLHAALLLPLDAADSQRSLARIEQQAVPDDIVDLLMQRVGHLPDKTQEVLKIAACLGNLFEVSTLSRVYGGELVDSLWPALQAELVFALDPVRSHADLTSSEIRCRFAHDRVQQAVLSMLDESARGALHLRIGRALLALEGEEPNSRQLFEATRHLNRALPWIEPGQERIHLGALNLAAARAALARAAAGEALDFTRAGLAALGERAWSEQYELARDLHLVLGEVGYALADDECLRSAIDEIVHNARTPLDVALIRRLEGQVYHTRFRIAEAFRTYSEALAHLGMTIPQSPSPAEVGGEIRQTFEAVRRRSFEELLALPACGDATISVAIEVLSRFILLAYATTSDLFPVLVCRQVRLSTEHGNTAESAIGYTFYGLLLSRDHDLDRACRFGKLALDLSHKFDDRKALSQTYLYANYQLMHWKVPLSELSESFRRAHEYALEVGAPFNTACSATTLCIARFWAGDELSELRQDLERYRGVILRLRQGMVLNWHEILEQTVLNLSSDRENPALLSGPVYDERERLAVHSSAGDHSALFNYHLAKTLLGYLFGEYGSALASADANQPFVGLYGTSLWAVPVVWLDALTRLAACRESEGAARERLLEQVRGDLEKLQTWLPHNESSLRHKVRTIEAALAQARGELRSAAQLFAEATAMARLDSAPHDEAVINELAGKFSIAAGDGGASRMYLRAAHRAYLRWGATGKALALEREHPRQLPNVALGSVGVTAAAISTQAFDLLDMVSVLNASRALSGEIKLERLLSRLMALLVESGGAETGFLLMQREGHWEIEVGHSSPALPLATKAVDGPGGERLAPSVVAHVVRTGETVVLEDACHQGPFQRDPHIAENHVRSVLCFALRRQGTLFAVVYLENNAARAVFTANSVHILEMLSTQAVASLENAVLYERLEQKVASRTRELEEKNVELARALQRVTVMQERLITQEKLAALGALTAGIAHEIKNPLNFVANFADVAVGLSDDLRGLIAPQIAPGPGFGGLRQEVMELLDDLQSTAEKIREHGARATAIVNGMAMHARKSGGQREPTDLNALLSQSVMLATHSARHQRREVRISTEYDPALGNIQAVGQDLSRVFVNLINNALYSVEQKSSNRGPGFSPSISLRTADLGDRVEVRVRDNGTGIPQSLQSKVFTPFFTTKPSGHGSGLGLSISHDVIVHGHGGDLRVDSVEGEYAEFIVTLPRSNESVS